MVPMMMPPPSLPKPPPPCPCKDSNDNELLFTLLCVLCDKHYHGRCIGVTEENAVDVIQYVCEACTTDKRTSQVTTCKFLYCTLLCSIHIISF